MDFNEPVLKLKKLRPSVLTPTLNSTWAAGFDCFTWKEDVIPPWSIKLISLGFGVQTPWGCYGQLVAARELTFYTGAFIIPSIIDPDDRAEITVSL